VAQDVVVGQSLDVGGGQAQALAQDAAGVGAEDGRRRAARVGAVERDWQAGSQVVAEARLMQPRKQRVIGHFRPRRDLGEGGVPFEQHGGGRQCSSDLPGAVVGEPGSEQAREDIAVAVTVALVGEVHAEGIGER